MLALLVQGFVQSGFESSWGSRCLGFSRKLVQKFCHSHSWDFFSVCWNRISFVAKSGLPQCIIKYILNNDVIWGCTLQRLTNKHAFLNRHLSLEVVKTGLETSCVELSASQCPCWEQTSCLPIVPCHVPGTDVFSRPTLSIQLQI